MRTKHGNIELAGATTSSDTGAIKAFREKSGADYPILHGLSADTAKAYGVTSYPYFVVLNEDGSIAGNGEAALTKAVGG